MRKGISESKNANIDFSSGVVKKLKSKGYKYFLVKGLTADRHFDYVHPFLLVLVPVRELPEDQEQKGIYAPLDSAMLEEWASEGDERMKVTIDLSKVN